MGSTVHCWALAASFSLLILFIYIYICATRNKILGLKRGPLSLVSTTEELLDRKVAAPV
jgi:hypothetical protein